ncbi:MAG: hypothetical protein AUH29_13690 [Candidatus Rokubacteria bacterium 13_1_40CM_69_27]|nr:MAG: hypothetical protein AUH29_13690 [Candidatus Rokubacteria bacterium 13_1_40CM_69_27]OLC33852.1 MAG: hypothetical protein AUH81_13165 [Candidatus Rokubacteria bacterium 13_1_40CM_4_69_5]
MSTRRPGLLLAGLVGAIATLALAAGCAGRRVDHGVFHSSKGYRVTVPGSDWAVVEQSRADLELRHRGGAAGMLVNAACEGAAARRPAGLLTRRLLAGLRDRTVIGRGEVSVDGRQGTRTIVEARGETEGPRLKIETLTVTDARCVYDLIYAAPVDTFGDWRGDFDRFVASFFME